MLKISVSVFAYGSDDQDENGLRLETSQSHNVAVTHHIPLLEEHVKGFLSEVRPLRNIVTQQKSQWKCLVDPPPPPCPLYHGGGVTLLVRPTVLPGLLQG